MADSCSSSSSEEEHVILLDASAVLQQIDDEEKKDKLKKLKYKQMYYICHVSLFIKLLHVLPVHERLLMYNWCNKLNTVVKWNDMHNIHCFIYYIMPLYVLLLLILCYQVFILHRVSFICDCTYEYVCNVSFPATEVE